MLFCLRSQKNVFFKSLTTLFIFIREARNLLRLFFIDKQYCYIIETLMKKTVKHIKIAAFSIILIEMIVIVGFVVIYLNNFFKIQEHVETYLVILSALGVVVLNCLLLWVFVLRVSRLRSKSDLNAAEVIGSDVQEAYNFAMLGLLVTDENDIVLWSNDLFKTRHIDLIDTNLLEWQPALANLKEEGSDAIDKIVVNNRNYEVKFLAEAGLWIFKDTTDFESLYQYSKEQAPVVGLLSIDNYNDAIRGEDESNDVITKLKNVIFNYAKDFDILLRKHREDTYLMLCNYDTFTRMSADNFSIIDKAREVSRDEDVPLTLSIGIAHDFPDVVKLNELATAALEIAMSRGGDQVVVSAYGKEMQFFGGKSEAQETRNRVKIRVLADSLISLIKGASNVLIMGHKVMDMDALGACLGVMALCKRLSVPSRIVVDYKLTETKTKTAILSQFAKDDLDEMLVSPNNAEDKIKPDTLLIVVDVHIPSMVMAPNLLEKATKIVVIDHHRRAEEYIESPVFNHIDPSASSTSEIVTEFLHFSSINPKVELPETYATILLSGIFLDTSYLKSKRTGVRTFEACTILKEYGADNSIADDLLKDDYEEFVEINEVVRNIKTPYYGVVYAAGNAEKIYDSATIAKCANTCLTMKGIHVSFIFAKVGPREIRMSCRSDGLVNVQLIAEKLGGGGHFSSAAVQFNSNDLSYVENLLTEALSRHLNAAKADAKSRKNED